VDHKSSNTEIQDRPFKKMFDAIIKQQMKKPVNLILEYHGGCFQLNTRMTVNVQIKRLIGHWHHCHHCHHLKCAPRNFIPMKSSRLKAGVSIVRCNSVIPPSYHPKSLLTLPPIGQHPNPKTPPSLTHSFTHSLIDHAPSHCLNPFTRSRVTMASRSVAGCSSRTRRLLK
jgi:hypothetical protein